MKGVIAIALLATAALTQRPELIAVDGGQLQQASQRKSLSMSLRKGSGTDPMNKTMYFSDITLGTGILN